LSLLASPCPSLFGIDNEPCPGPSTATGAALRRRPPAGQGRLNDEAPFCLVSLPPAVCFFYGPAYDRYGLNLFVGCSALPSLQSSARGSACARLPPSAVPFLCGVFCRAGAARSMHDRLCIIPPNLFFRRASPRGPSPLPYVCHRQRDDRPPDDPRADSRPSALGGRVLPGFIRSR